MGLSGESMELSRRRTLALGLAAGAAFAVGVTVHLPPPASGARVLSAAELDTLAAVAVTLFPGVHFPIDGLAAGVPQRVDELLDQLLDPTRQAGFRYMLRALEWGTLASRGVRFSQLDGDSRVAVLEAWGDPDVVPRRLAADSLRAILAMAYFAHPDVQAAIGWRSMCSVRAA